MAETRLGPAGRLAAAFQGAKLTPLLALLGLLMGLFAVVVTPREEEPQIDVTFANILIPFPGASAEDVRSLVSLPMEQVLAEIEGVKHTYSVSYPDRSILTVQFEVGEPRNDAIVRVYNAVFSNQDWMPPGAGVLQPLIRPMGIDDVPVLAVTLWTEDPRRGAYELQRVAHALEAEIKRVPGTRDVFTIGGPERAVRVRLDPERLAAWRISHETLRGALANAQAVTQAGGLVTGGEYLPVTAGTFLRSAAEVAGVVIALHDGHPVYLRDVAEVTEGPDQPDRSVWFGTGESAAAEGLVPGIDAPAVTLAVAKKPGTNAADVTREVRARLAALQGTLIPDGVGVTVTRDYGMTADEKASQLIHKLVFATGSVILLVLLVLGWREALIVGSAVVLTLAMTLFASWAWGFTINRVSLFALIFSIGILVDDAIVVVENVHRHLRLGGGSLREIIPRAVDEVGGPTILATLTVIAALLPMAFVTGLMGPYMSPIPINASIGMLISLLVAFVFTPWMSERWLGRAHAGHGQEEGGGNGGRWDRAFHDLLSPFLLAAGGRARRRLLYAGTLLAIALAVSLVPVQWVVLKMLPFDNKSEFQVVLDMPEGTPLEGTARVLRELAEAVGALPEVTHYQAYAGTASPIGFNGLVRQYYLRQAPHLGDLQVNLVRKSQRDRHSHDIVRAARPLLAPIAERYGASIAVVEVPPGPPVLAPVVAEIYGPDYDEQRRLGKAVAALFREMPDMVDVGDSVEAPARRLVIEVDRARAALLGVSQRSIAEAVQMALAGDDVIYVSSGYDKYPVPVRLEFDVADQGDLDRLLMLPVPGTGGELISLSEMVTVRESGWQRAIHHKDLLPVVYVTADEAGALDSPLYGLFEASGRLAEEGAGGVAIEQRLLSQPGHAFDYSLKWDGEWQITYETFRDMGIAYSVGLLLIYLLIVAQFGSYLVPLVIMAPIPLTIVGVLPGHALLGAQFTATSMIGMIALAGIIVRNSILLVDFVNQQLADGVPARDAIVHAAAVRSKPILMTAAAAMMGAFFILDDPIFNGLAVSLVFGLLVATLLTLVLIPVGYYALIERGWVKLPNAHD